MRKIAYTFKVRTLIMPIVFGLMVSGPPACASEAWQGEALGFVPSTPGLLGDMGGVRPVLDADGFHFNLGY